MNQIQTVSIKTTLVTLATLAASATLTNYRTSSTNRSCLVPLNCSGLEKPICLLWCVTVEYFSQATFLGCAFIHWQYDFFPTGTFSKDMLPAQCLAFKSEAKSLRTSLNLGWMEMTFVGNKSRHQAQLSKTHPTDIEIYFRRLGN